MNAQERYNEYQQILKAVDEHERGEPDLFGKGWQSWWSTRTRLLEQHALAYHNWQTAEDNEPLPDLVNRALNQIREGGLSYLTRENVLSECLLYGHGQAYDWIQKQRFTTWGTILAKFKRWLDAQVLDGFGRVIVLSAPDSSSNDVPF